MQEISTFVYTFQWRLWFSLQQSLDGKLGKVKSNHYTRLTISISLSTSMTDWLTHVWLTPCPIPYISWKRWSGKDYQTPCSYKKASHHLFSTVNANCSRYFSEAFGLLMELLFVLAQEREFWSQEKIGIWRENQMLWTNLKSSIFTLYTVYLWTIHIRTIWMKKYSENHISFEVNSITSWSYFRSVLTSRVRWRFDAGGHCRSLLGQHRQFSGRQRPNPKSSFPIGWSQKSK